MYRKRTLHFIHSRVTQMALAQKGKQQQGIHHYFQLHLLVQWMPQKSPKRRSFRHHRPSPRREQHLAPNPLGSFPLQVKPDHQPNKPNLDLQRTPPALLRQTIFNHPFLDPNLVHLPLEHLLLGPFQLLFGER